MIYKHPDLKIHSMTIYQRSAEHIHGRRHDRTMVDCAQVVFHKTLPDGKIESLTNHLVRVDGDDLTKWQVGDVGDWKVYIYIHNGTHEYLKTELFSPPPPQPPKPKRKRRRRRRKRKSKQQVTV